MRSFLVKAIPIFTIVLFISIMLSGHFLKRSIGNEPGIPDSIQSLINEVTAGNWSEAGKKTTELSNLWDKVVSRVQFSSERDEINAFGVNLARLKGAIEAQDKAGSLQELSEAYEHWLELGR